LSACSATLVAWWPPGSIPNPDTSSMCESQVTGCHATPWREVNAQTTPAHVSPPRTAGTSVT